MTGSKTDRDLPCRFFNGFPTETNTNVSGGEYFQQRPGLLERAEHTRVKLILQIIRIWVNNKVPNVNGYFNAYFSDPLLAASITHET